MDADPRLRHAPTQTARGGNGPGAVDIAEVVSDVRERLPGLPVAPRLEPEQARFRLFESVTAFLRNASRAHPLVVMLDDLHWADKPSLLLLEFLAREISDTRLLVVGTYRDVELRPPASPRTDAALRWPAIITANVCCCGAWAKVTSPVSLN